MKRFLSKSLLGIALLSGATLSSCSCKRYVDDNLLDHETAAVEEDARETVVETNSNQGENSQQNTGDENQTQPTIDPAIYSPNADLDAYLYGFFGQRKQLTAVIDGNVVDPTLCDWVSDHSDYISVNNQGIVEANSDLEYVDAKKAEIQAALMEKVSNGQLDPSALSQDELNKLQYDLGYDSIITATLKSDRTKSCVFKVGGGYNLSNRTFRTKYADPDKAEVAVHVVPYGQDSTVTFNLETEPVGHTTNLEYNSDTQSYEEVNVDVYKTHIIYIENHLNPKEYLIAAPDTSSIDISQFNCVDMFFQSENYALVNTIKPNNCADSNYIEIRKIPQAGTFTIDVENSLVHKHETNVMNQIDRLGTNFTITVNVVSA